MKLVPCQARAQLLKATGAYKKLVFYDQRNVWDCVCGTSSTEMIGGADESLDNLSHI